MGGQAVRRRGVLRLQGPVLGTRVIACALRRVYSRLLSGLTDASLNKAACTQTPGASSTRNASRVHSLAPRGATQKRAPVSVDTVQSGGASAGAQARQSSGRARLLEQARGPARFVEGAPANESGRVSDAIDQQRARRARGSPRTHGAARACQAAGSKRAPCAHAGTHAEASHRAARRLPSGTRLAHGSRRAAYGGRGGARRTVWAGHTCS